MGAESIDALAVYGNHIGVSPALVPILILNITLRLPHYTTRSQKPTLEYHHDLFR